MKKSIGNINMIKKTIKPYKNSTRITHRIFINKKGFKKF